MHGNEIIYALICTKNHVLLCQYSMLSVLLSRAMNKFKKTKSEEGQSSRGRGRGRERGRGRGRDQGRGKFQPNEEQKQEGTRKPFDKSKVKCYNCQEFGHFSDECKNEKKN